MSSGSPPKVFVHVGGPKTGTTYLQAVLWHNREALRAQAVCYPGNAADAHFLAAQDLLGIQFHEHDDPRVAGAWSRLVDEARGGARTIVISHELLSLASADAVGRAMRDLRFAAEAGAAEVHIVYTARDLARQIPSVWQEDLKNRHAVSFREFVRGVHGEDPDPHWLAGLFWRWQDVAGILRTWAADIGPERVHVVTVPPAGGPPGQLWERFATAIGIDPASCQTAVPHAANPSLGVVEANLLRRLNPRLGAEFAWPAYDRWVKQHLVGRILAARPDPIQPVLPAADHGWVLERCAELARTVAEREYDVVGDPADLMPAAAAGDARHPDDASDAELLDAASDALIAYLHALAGKAAPTADPDAPVPPELLPPMMLFRLAVQRLSKDHRSVALLRSAWATGRRTASRLRR